MVGLSGMGTVLSGVKKKRLDSSYKTSYRERAEPLGKHVTEGTKAYLWQIERESAQRTWSPDGVRLARFRSPIPGLIGAESAVRLKTNSRMLEEPVDRPWVQEWVQPTRKN